MAVFSSVDAPSVADRTPRARTSPTAPLAGLDAAAIDRLQREALGRPADPAGATSASALRELIAANHCWNRLLWDEEDQARRDDVEDAAIVRSKRAIDRYNQRRNDAIEAIDDALLAAARETPPDEDAWLNSETAGSIIDRLSINAHRCNREVAGESWQGPGCSSRSACIVASTRAGSSAARSSPTISSGPTGSDFDASATSSAAAGSPDWQAREALAIAEKQGKRSSHPCWHQDARSATSPVRRIRLRRSSSH